MAAATLAVVIRPAKTSDIPKIAAAMEPFVAARILLGKDLVALYETTHEFVVAETAAGVLQGFGALHVMWEHLAEVRTLAVVDAARGQGVGHQLLVALEQKARDLVVRQLVSLTFETEFFGRHGFQPIGEAPELIAADVYAQLLRSHDEGIAEFLDLARVKPNTLGNTRMMKTL